jgi:uncharacterized membrane protein
MPNPLHPVLVHVPLGLAVALPLLAIGVAVALWRNALPRRAWVLVVALQIVLVGGGLAAFQAGHKDGDRVEKIVGEKAVDEHEERAEAFLWAAGAVAVVSAAVLLVPAGAVVPLAAVAALGSLVVAGLGIWTGKAGGALVYERGAASAYVGRGSAAPVAEPSEEHRHHSEREDD